MSKFFFSIRPDFCILKQKSLIVLCSAPLLPKIFVHSPACYAGLYSSPKDGKNLKMHYFVPNPTFFLHIWEIMCIFAENF